MCGKLPLLMGLCSLLAIQLHGPLKDLTRPAGGVIDGFGALLNRSTHFAFEVLEDVRYEAMEFHRGTQIDNLGAHGGTWCIEDIPRNETDHTVASFARSFPRAPGNLVNVLSETFESLKRGATQVKNMVRDYKAQHLSDGFAAMVLGRRRKSLYTICVSFSFLEIRLSWRNFLFRPFSVPDPLDPRAAPFIHNSIRMELLRTLQQDFPDQLEITHGYRQPQGLAFKHLP